MRIHAYLRASTKEQDATRATTVLNDFIQSHNHTIEQFHYENESGSKLDRPVLMQLLDSVNTGDVILVEQVDRLTRLQASEWESLKRTINDKGVSLVSLDLPTSYTVLSKGSIDDFTKGVMKAVNGMMLDILAVTARKDYEDRRRRQAQGIAKAKAEGKFKGKQQSAETVAKCEEALKLVNENNLSKGDAAKLAGVGRATFYRWLGK